MTEPLVLRFYEFLFKKVIGSLKVQVDVNKQVTVLKVDYINTFKKKKKLSRLLLPDCDTCIRVLN